MRVIPLTLDRANALVAELHRHHKPARGHRFSLGLIDDAGTLRGAAIVGRPVARQIDQQTVAEVTRLVTDGVANGCCSLLYGAAARVARAMGFEKIQTYILGDEPGVTLRAAGWTLDTITLAASGATAGEAAPTTTRPARNNDGRARSTRPPPRPAEVEP